MEFAGSQTKYQAHTVKLAVAVHNWPFLSLMNSLGIVFEAKGNGGSGKKCQSNNNAVDSVQWTMVVLDDVTLYLFQESREATKRASEWRKK